MPYTVEPLLETTCIKRPLALRDNCSDTTTLLNQEETIFITSLE